MATPAVPAVFVPDLDDARLFPQDESAESNRDGAPPAPVSSVIITASGGATRPTLYTTVGDDPPQNAGCKGKCDYAGCECLYFAGKESGTCARCSHANLYHRVKIRRVDLEAKAAADAAKREKHRRHIPTQQEIEEMKQKEETKPPEPVNTYPCDVPDCECKKMAQPLNFDPASPFPKLCRTCKHAEVYHIKRPKGEKDKKRRGAPSKSAASKGKAASAAKK